jgi:undecaprenyl pyrophosphate phosphatase UppP
MGLAQIPLIFVGCLAITISAGRFLSLTRGAAACVSFLLAPIVSGAVLMTGYADVLNG